MIGTGRRPFAILACSFYCHLLLGISGKRVIFTFLPINSHAYIHVTLARALSARGHEVWLVVHSSILEKGYVSLHGRGMHVIEYNTSYRLDEDLLVGLFFRPFLSDQNMHWDKVSEMAATFSQDVFGNETLFKEMQKVEPDLFVVDADLTFAKMFAVFPYRLSVPFAMIDYSFQPLYRRIPFSPATTPAFFTTFGPRMTFLERMENALVYLMSYFFMSSPMLYQDAVARFAAEMPYLSLDQLEARAEIWLVQTDHLFFYPEPTLPNVKHIGGLAAAPATKSLPELFRTFLDDAPEGVVVVSFGSMVTELSANITGKLLAAFRQLKPVRFVVRLDVQSPDPEHIMTSSWLPQNELLAHSQCRVLVTHCGLSGQYQAMYHAVPMLGLPLLYDQFYNANVMQRKGFGLALEVKKASVEELVSALQELLHNATYRHNLSRASALFRQLYGVPVTSAVYWLEHVLEQGGGHMRAAGQEMPLYQFLLLDVLAVLASLASLAGLALTCCLRLFCLWAAGVFRRRGPKDKPKGE